jgi:hypothetical protein
MIRFYKSTFLALLLTACLAPCLPKISYATPGAEKLYRIIARKVNMSKAEVPTFNSSQKLEHKGKFCQMTLKWRNVSCTDIYSFNLKDFDSNQLGTRMSNIYPRIILKVADKTKRVKHTKQCVDGTSKEESLDKISFDLKRPGGLDVYKTAAAFVHLIRHCGGK